LSDEKGDLVSLRKTSSVRTGDFREVEHRIENVGIVEDLRKNEGEKGVEFGKIVLL